MLPLALKSLITLLENHSKTSAKVLPAQIRFFKHWVKLTDAERLVAFKDENLLKNALVEISLMGGPNVEKFEEALLEKVKGIKTMEQANEYIKLKMKGVIRAYAIEFEELAVKALANDESRIEKIPVAENLLRRVIKSGGSGGQFKAKAHEYFKLAKAFE